MKAEPHVVRHAMQLQEVLVVMCLAIILAGLMIRMTAHCWEYCRDATTLARLSQETLILRNTWREFVHHCPGKMRLQNGRLLGARGWSARISDGVLYIRQNDVEKRLALHGGMHAEIQSDTASGQADAWVLRLTWNGRTKRKPSQRTARIVACRGGNAS